MSKMTLWLGLLLALSAGHLDAWFWNKDPDPTTQAPTKAPPLGKAGGQPKRGEENLAGVGAEIINVADGIRKFVQTWDATPTTWTDGGVASPTTQTVNKEESGSGEGSGSGSKEGSGYWEGSGRGGKEGCGGVDGSGSGTK